MPWKSTGGWRDIPQKRGHVYQLFCCVTSHHRLCCCRRGRHPSQSCGCTTECSLALFVLKGLMRLRPRQGAGLSSAAHPDPGGAAVGRAPVPAGCHPLRSQGLLAPRPLHLCHQEPCACGPSICATRSRVPAAPGPQTAASSVSHQRKRPAFKGLLRLDWAQERLSWLTQRSRIYHLDYKAASLCRLRGSSTDQAAHDEDGNVGVLSWRPDIQGHGAGQGWFF